MAGRRTYSLTFEYQYDLVGADGRVFIQVFDSVSKLINTFPTGDGAALPSSREWSTWTMEFEPPALATSARLLLRKAGVGELWIGPVRLDCGD